MLIFGKCIAHVNAVSWASESSQPLVQKRSMLRKEALCEVIIQ